MIPATSLAQELKITVTNPSAMARANEPVVVSWATIAKQLPRASATTVQLTDEQGRPFRVQVDDLNLDGTLDELTFVADFASKQQRSFTLAVVSGESLPSRQEPFRTDAADWKRINGVLQSVDDDDVPGSGRDRRLYRFDGVGWESDVVAYRLYLDERNAVDIQGKRKPGLYWKYIGISGVDYQQDADWGMDVLHVGPALGLGGIGFWVGDSVLKPVKLDRLRCRIVARGPVRAVVRVDYYGWELDEGKVDVTSLFTIYAGDRVSEHQVILQGAKSAKTIATGIVKHTAGIRHWNPQGTWLYTLGPQSRANDDLLMALHIPQSTLVKKVEDEYNHLLLLQLERTRPVRFFLSSVWQGESGTMWTEAEIESFLERTSLRLNQPLTVDLR